jgi:hypothetical protein
MDFRDRIDVRAHDDVDLWTATRLKVPWDLRWQRLICEG